MLRTALLILLLCIFSVRGFAQNVEYVTTIADSIRSNYSEGRLSQTTATGNVRINLKDAQITADQAIYDHISQDLSVSGNVSYISDTQTFHGNLLETNAKTRTWKLDKYDIILQPSLINNQILEPIFLRGASADRLATGVIDATGTEVTTCDLPQPHYHFSSEKAVLTPGRSLVMEHASVYFKDRRLYTIPRLYIPLNEKNDPRITPLVGQSEEEGFYLKSAYNYAAPGDLGGLILLDLMSKKGIGKGIDHSYRLGNQTGRVRLYHLYDRTISQNTFDGTLNHSGTLAGFKMNASADFRSNSYLYAAGSKTFNERLTLTKSDSSYSTSLYLTRSINETFTKTTRLSGMLRHSQNLSTRSTISGDFDFSGYSSGSYDENKLTSQVDMAYRMPEADFLLSTRRFTDFTEDPATLAGFYGTEKLPELGLTSTSKRLNLPLRNTAFAFAYGKYLESPALSPVERVFFSAKLSSARRDMGKGWSISDSGGFEQYVYGDNTAQYTIEHFLQVERKLGPKSSFSLNHRFQRPAGYTPLRLDYNGRYNSVFASLNLRDSKVHSLSLSTGYDFEEASAGWQDILFRSKYAPSTKFSLYTSTGFDIERSQWRTLINQINFNPNPEFRLGIGSRYDTINERWSLLRMVLDSQINPLTRLQMIQSYNGATKELDYSALRLTRDLHCWETSLTFTRQKGFVNSQGLMFNLSLKALPYTPAFGTGQYGQSLEVGSGEIY